MTEDYIYYALLNRSEFLNSYGHHIRQVTLPYQCKGCQKKAKKSYTIADAFYFSYSKGFLCFEIKTSLQDLKSELKSKKYLNAYNYCNKFYLAIPGDLYKKALELCPQEWGIMTVNPSETMRLRRQSFVINESFKTLPFNLFMCF